MTRSSTESFNIQRMMLGVLLAFLLPVVASYGQLVSQSRPVTYPIRVMPVGDSITQGDVYHNTYRRALWLRLQEAGYDVDFVGTLTYHFGGPPPNPDFDQNHEGHWGWRADEILRIIGTSAQAVQPDIVLLHLGSNDMFQGQSAESTINDISQIIDTLRRVNPRVTVFVCQVIPTYQDYFNNRLNALNALIPNFARQKDTPQSRVLKVDMNTVVNRYTDLYDGVHPNAQGEEKIAAKWMTRLEEYWESLPGSSDTRKVFAHLERTQWETSGNNNGLLKPAIYTVLNGLGLIVDDPAESFGYWQTKEAFPPLEAGLYRLRAHLLSVREEDTRFPELRIRVFRANNTRSDMVVYAQTQPNTGMPEYVDVIWQSDGVSSWRVSFDLLSFVPTQGGGYLISEITNEKIY